jgi:drug/metabolite transporter (DMT)-like permease
MLCGGLMLFVFSLITGEPAEFAWSNLTSRGIGSWFFLVFFGSIIGFSSFNYLLTKVSPDKVATANYVNPVVALLLGWGLNNEFISSRSLLAAAILIFSVFLVNIKWSAKFYSGKNRKLSGKI